MKTLKFALIAAFLSLVLTGYSADHKKNVVRTVKISIDKALDDRGLVREMFIQLDEKFLDVDGSRLYFAKVKYENSLYLIYGTYKEWESFFLMDNHIPRGIKSAGEIQGKLIH
jgi:hypothetical protein